jgi:hypothetical protein
MFLNMFPARSWMAPVAADRGDSTVCRRAVSGVSISIRGSAMRLVFRKVAAALERSATNIVDWFQFDHVLGDFSARGFGPAPIPLYVEREKVVLKNTHLWDR